MPIETVGVVGAGLMGSGIAEVAARAGLRTRVREIDDTALEAGRQRIERSLARAVDGGKLSEEDAAAVRGRLSFSTSLDDFADCDLVIEAAAEQLDLKRQIFADLDRITPAHAILASNTSSLPIVEIASATKRPAQVVGMHFFNPAPVMKLVELVRSIVTSDATLDTARSVAERMGKTVVVAQDRAGFIVNLLLIPYLTHAIRLYESGFASREDIDTGMKLGCGHPMGPLELLDYVGLDTTLFVCEVIQREYGNPEFAPPPLLRRMVAAGQLGRKSGRGFYDYAKS